MSTVDYEVKGKEHRSRFNRYLVSGVALASLMLAIPVVSMTGVSAASSWTPGQGVPAPCIAAKNCKFGFIVASAVPALVSMGQGALIESTHLGVGFTEQSIGFDPNQQLSVMQSMISQGVNAILTSPLDTSSIETGILAAQAAGIPVVFYDGSAPKLTMNIENADQASATAMVGVVATQLKKLHKACSLGLVDGLAAIPALGARDKGFVAGAKKYHCKVLSTQVDTADTSTAAAGYAHQWKSQFGNKMTAIISYNDNAEMGVYSATVTGSFKPLLVSFNGESSNLKLLAAGKVFADYALQNSVMGEAMALGAYNALLGKNVPSNVRSPYVLLTKSNVKTYTSDADILNLPVGKITFGRVVGGISALSDSAFKP
jgi:ABC-type sugar transport system substrate-binding protein